MKLSLFSTLILMISVSVSADILRPRGPWRPPINMPVAKPAGFICTYVTKESKRTIEVAGFSENYEKLPAKYDKMMWPGQVAAIEKGSKEPQYIYDLVQLNVGRSGFAGRVVKIDAALDSQTLRISFATGASGPTNGSLTIKKGNKVVTSGPTNCRLI